MTRRATAMDRLDWAVALLLLPGVVSALSVEDDAGRTVTLEAPAERIVSLAPHATELAFAAGAGDRVVGTVSYSDYPPAAREIPRVGSSEAVNYERLLALRPELVMVWGSGNGPAVRERLVELGLTVFVSEPRELEDIPRTIEALGALAGTGAQAQAAATAFRRRLAGLSQRYASRSPVSVFVELWHRPVMTVNGDHLISRLLRLCGGRNVFAALPTLVPTVSTEAVLAADPEVIVAAGSGAERPSWLDTWRRWDGLSAARHGHLFAIEPALLYRATPRVLDGAQRLCRAFEQARRETGYRRERSAAAMAATASRVAR